MKKEWTVIVNKHWEQHLASGYDPKDDLIRMTVKPKKTGHAFKLSVKRKILYNVNSFTNKIKIKCKKLQMIKAIRILVACQTKKQQQKIKMKKLRKPTPAQCIQKWFQISRENAQSAE